MKSQTARSLAATAFFAGSTCVGPGCVSAPKPRPPPPPAECPRGSDATYKRFDLSSEHPVSLVPSRRIEEIPVQAGDVTAYIIGPWGSFPDHTTFSGRLFLGQERVYGRFTEARLPSGETVPVCLQLFWIGDNPPLGIPMRPGSTATRAIIISSVWVEAVSRFE